VGLHRLLRPFLRLIAQNVLESEKDEYRSDPESYYYLYGEEGIPWYNSEKKIQKTKIDTLLDNSITQSTIYEYEHA
jgi:hypothetical protein